MSFVILRCVLSWRRGGGCLNETAPIDVFFVPFLNHMHSHSTLLLLFFCHRVSKSKNLTYLVHAARNLVEGLAERFSLICELTFKILYPEV